MSTETPPAEQPEDAAGEAQTLSYKEDEWEAVLRDFLEDKGIDTNCPLLQLIPIAEEYEMGQEILEAGGMRAYL